jgi:hypothetical protein
MSAATLFLFLYFVSLHPSVQAFEVRSSSRKASLSLQAGSVQEVERASSGVPSPFDVFRMQQIAKEYIETGSGFASPVKADMMSEDFVFRGAVVGPLCKRDYIRTLKDGFGLYRSIPNMRPNSFGYIQDPNNLWRLWFFTRYTGTNTNPINLGVELPATNKEVQSGIEANSIMFDKNLKIKHLTVGYIADFDDPGSKSGGFGAAFGVFKALGINLPTGKAFNTAQKVLKSFARDSNSASLLNNFRSVSNEEDIPEWYKNYVPMRRGAEGFPW